MKLSPYTELQQAHLKKSINLISAVVLLAVLVNAAVGGLVTYRSWSGLHQAKDQLAERTAAFQAVQAKPVVKQAEDSDIAGLLAALPMDLQLSELSQFVRTAADKSGVLFIRLSEEQGDAAASNSTPVEVPPATDLSGDGSTAAPAAGSPVQTAGGVLPYSFSTTLYGELEDLVSFVTALYDADRFLTVDTVNLVKATDAGTDDIGKLLARLPRVPDSRKLYSLDLTFHAFTLPEQFRQQLNVDKAQITFAP